MRLFISYAKVNKKLVDKLVTILRDGGHDPWYDYGLMPGQDWKAELLKQITACDQFVYALTPESVASEWCQWEFVQAVGLGKPIIPVLLAKNTQLPDGLTAIQYADLSAGFTNRAAAKLIGGIYQLGVILPKGTVSAAPGEPHGLPAQVGEVEIAPPSASTHGPILDILPPPFEWVEIPAGKVTLEAGGYVPEGGQAFELPYFAIGKYPITNAQFQVFAEAEDGYRNSDWWRFSASAQVGRMRNVQPQDPAFGGIADHPRVNVTWDEAVAFCRWLSSRVGYELRLPTEQEWQRAAQGDDGRKYPWGNQEPDRTRANYGNKLGKTTPVGNFPAGASLFGVLDMTGNVWEWCANDWYTGNPDIRWSGNEHILRGGSWDESYFLHVAYRANRAYGRMSNDIGFRCARS